MKRLWYINVIYRPTTIIEPFFVLQITDTHKVEAPIQASHRVGVYYKVEAQVPYRVEVPYGRGPRPTGWSAWLIHTNALLSRPHNCWVIRSCKYISANSLARPHICSPVPSCIPYVTVTLRYSHRPANGIPPSNDTTIQRYHHPTIHRYNITHEHSF